MDEFFIPINSHLRDTLTQESSLIRLLLETEDTINNSVNVQTPFTSSPDCIETCFQLMMGQPIIKNVNSTLCQEVLQLLDFLSADKAMNRLFEALVTSNMSTLNSIWMFAASIQVVFPPPNTIFNTFTTRFHELGLNLFTITQTKSPRRARSQIRSYLRAAAFRQHHNTFSCPFCNCRLHFERDQQQTTRTNCCGSYIHTATLCAQRFLTQWNCNYCQCALDSHGNLQHTEVFYAEGQRFHIRNKRGIESYAILPTLNLNHLLPTRLNRRNKPMFIHPD